MLLSALLLGLSSALPAPVMSPADTEPPVATVSGIVLPLAVPLDTGRARARAIEYSEAYNTRLTIHRIGSYAMLPLFAGEYSLGQNLLNDSRTSTWMKPAHLGVALGLGALFTVNTATGVWNLWDAREDPAGRTRRITHTVLMLASDAGFVWTGQLGGGAKHSYTTGQQHRNVALGSMALSTVGAAMMWLWKD